MAWTSPRTWVASEVVTAALLNTHLRDNQKAIGDPWPAYTPVWSSSGTQPAIGNGTIVGAWLSIGKLVHFRVVITMGSTTTYGTSTYSVSLPATSIASAGRQAVAGIAYDNSATGNFPVDAIIVSSATTALLTTWPTSAAGAALISVTPGAPFTWATSDVLTINGTYEAA